MTKSFTWLKLLEIFQKLKRSKITVLWLHNLNDSSGREVSELTVKFHFHSNKLWKESPAKLSASKIK